MPVPTKAEMDAEAADVAAALKLMDASPPAVEPVVQVEPLRVVAPEAPKAETPPPPPVETPAPPPSPPVAVRSAEIAEIDRISSERLEQLRAKQLQRQGALPERPAAPTPPPPNTIDLVAPAAAKPAVGPLDIEHLLAQARELGVNPKEFVLAFIDKINKPAEPAKKFEKPRVLSEIDQIKQDLADERKARVELEQSLGNARDEYVQQQRLRAEQETDARIFGSAARAFIGDEPEAVAARKTYPWLAKRDGSWVGRAVLGAVKRQVAENEKRVAQNLPPLSLTTEKIFGDLDKWNESEARTFGLTAPVAAPVAPVAPVVAPKQPGATPLSSPTQGNAFVVPRGYEGIRLKPGETAQDFQDAIAAASLLID